MVRANRQAAGRWTAVFLLPAVLAAGTKVLPAEPDKPKQPAKLPEVSPAAADESAKRQEGIPLEAVERMVRAIKVYAVDDGARTQLKLQKGPLVRHLDVTQAYSDGTMWVWGGQGRPHAVLTLSIVGKARWIHEFNSLSTNGVEADPGGGPKWLPKRPGWDPQPFPSAPVPAKTDRARLRQMKELARRFTAFEYYTDLYHPGQRYELRLMPQPVYRYGKPEGSPLDGAFFVIAKGTNPEILLVIELQAPGDTAGGWRYNCSRVSAAGLSLGLDGKEVWKRDAIHVSSTSVSDPYWIHGTAVSSIR